MRPFFIKLLAVCLCAAGLFCCAPLKARAADDTVENVSYHGLLDSWLLFLEAGGDPATLDLPDSAIVLPGYHTCEVEWDLAGFDSRATGLQMLTGTVVEPEGVDFYKNDEHTVLLVKQEIVVHDQSTRVPLLLGRPAATAGFSPTLAVGTPMAELEALFAGAFNPQVMLMTESGFVLNVDCTSDINAVDPSKRGAYWPHSYAMPPGTVLDDRSDMEGMAVYVVDPDKVEFALTARLSFGNAQIYAKWLYDAQDPVLEYAACDTEPAENEKHLWTAFEACSVYSDYVLINLYDLTPGTYFFRIRYDGNAVSDVLKLVSDGKHTLTLTGGDRDGGDTDEQDVPKLEQETPIKPSGENTADPGTGGGGAEENGGRAITVGARAAAAPANGGAASRSATETVTERITAVQTAVSGLRLREMMALQPGGVLFQKDGISAWLDNAMLEVLDIADGDLFTVRLEVTGPGRFLFEVLLNEQPLSSVPDTRVRLEYTPSSMQNLACTGEGGQTARDVSYSEETLSLSMLLDETGQYTVTCDAPAAVIPSDTGIAAGPPATSWGLLQTSLLGGVVALSVVAGIIGQRIWRRRHGAAG